MAKVKNGIKIVQYHENWAKEVAKMWNLSRDGWGGDTRVMTEDQVKQKEANSDNIELYLAVDGEDVVGYCGLSEYKEDTGSLYIPLLNVRPDYHGKKIGKMLVLQALEKTIELGWPRLDLYTWPGNTKAVPLYKKCGFFWEDRDDTTHLMNFIPHVLKTPLIKPLFTKLNWYEASERIIEVKPDGAKENGFTFYEYSWKNENQFARVQFERTGRGIRLIETNDFLLEICMDNHEIIEQEPIPFQIKFLNKTNQSVTLNVVGAGNERVKYSVNQGMIVEKDAIVTSTVMVTQGEEPSPWKTHPFISVNVSVNGLESELRLGVFPVQPAKLDAHFAGNIAFLNKESFIELVVKNNLKEDTQFSIEFPENELVRLDSNTLTFPIVAGGRKNVRIPLVVLKHGFYNPSLKVIAKKSDDNELVFNQEISVAFKGLGEKFGGESKDYWHVFNGLSQINLRKRDLLMTVAKNQNKKQPLAFFSPKLGKPFTNEFTKKKPESVIWEVNNSSVSLKLVLQSDDMPGIQITQNMELFGDGFAHKWFNVENTGTTIYHETAIRSPHYHELAQTYMPLDGEIVEFAENRIIEFGDLTPTSISENWYFSKNHPAPIGIAWSKQCKAEPEGWQFVIEDELGELLPGDMKMSKKAIISIGAFENWKEFRSFALGSLVTEKPETIGELSLHSHPISNNSELHFTLKTFRNSFLEGQLKISIHEEEIYHTSIMASEEKLEHSFQLKKLQDDPILILEGQYHADSMKTEFKELVIKPSSDIVTTQSLSEHHVKLDNGCMELKVDTSFYPGVYSLSVNGNEWLDNSYPNIKAKSWWNPWAGGLKTVPSGLNTFSLLKEEHTVFPVKKTDTKGHSWSGVAISTQIKEHSEWKGVHFIQHYLMLPGVPLVAFYIEVIDSGGKNVKAESWLTDMFVGGEDLSNIIVSLNGTQQTKQYRSGVQELPISFEPDSYLSSTSKTEKLYLVPSGYSEQAEVYTNKEALQLTANHSALPSENGYKTAQSFILFDERQLAAGILQKLRKIQF